MSQRKKAEGGGEGLKTGCESYHASREKALFVEKRLTSNEKEIQNSLRTRQSRTSITCRRGGLAEKMQGRQRRSPRLLKGKERNRGEKITSLKREKESSRISEGDTGLEIKTQGDNSASYSIKTKRKRFKGDSSDRATAAKTET